MRQGTASTSRWLAVTVAADVVGLALSLILGFVYGFDADLPWGWDLTLGSFVIVTVGAFIASMCVGRWDVRRSRRAAAR